MKCDNCVQKNNHRYIYGKRLTGFSQMPQAAFDLLDKKLKDETQCQCIPRFNLDMTEVIIECCRDERLTEDDTAGWNLDEYYDWSEEEAKNYISQNINNWETLED